MIVPTVVILFVVSVTTVVLLVASMRATRAQRDPVERRVNVAVRRMLALNWGLVAACLPVTQFVPPPGPFVAVAVWAPLLFGGFFYTRHRIKKMRLLARGGM